MLSGGIVGVLRKVALFTGGNESLKEGRQKLYASAVDDYTQLLPVEQLGTDGQVFIRIGRGVIINISYLYTISLPKQQLQLRSPYGQVRTLTVPREALKQLKNYIDERLKKNKDNGED